jgi:hypothetical protein
MLTFDLVSSPHTESVQQVQYPHFKEGKVRSKEVKNLTRVPQVSWHNEDLNLGPNPLWLLGLPNNLAEAGLRTPQLIQGKCHLCPWGDLICHPPAHITPQVARRCSCPSRVPATCDDTKPRSYVV